VQSLIRDDTSAALLLPDGHLPIQAPQTRRLSDEVSRRTLIGCYHNLIREWSDT